MSDPKRHNGKIDPVRVAERDLDWTMAELRIGYREATRNAHYAIHENNHLLAQDWRGIAKTISDKYLLAGGKHADLRPIRQAAQLAALKKARSLA